MFMLTGRTFIAFDDHLGRATVGLLTQSQGNTNEDEWFALLANLIGTNSKVHIASFRGMAIDAEEVKSMIFHDNNQGQWKIKALKMLIFRNLQKFESNF